MMKRKPVSSMNPVVLISVALIAAVVIYAFVRRPTRITASQIPAVVAQLQSRGKDKAFATFTFEPPGAVDEVSIQFSLEGQTLGLDWIYAAAEIGTGSPSYSRNALDRQRFASFARNLGYEVLQRETRYAKYLRVERGGSLIDLALKTLKELYGVAPTDPITVEIDGFSLQR